PSIQWSCSIGLNHCNHLKHNNNLGDKYGDGIHMPSVKVLMQVLDYPLGVPLVHLNVACKHRLPALCDIDPDTVTRDHHVQLRSLHHHALYGLPAERVFSRLWI